MRLPIEIDGATTRLIALTNGLAATDVLPAASAKSLVKLSKSVRLFCEAREYALARAVLVEIERLASTANGELSVLPDVIRGHLTPLGRVIDRHVPADAKSIDLSEAPLRAIQ